MGDCVLAFDMLVKDSFVFGAVRASKTAPESHPFHLLPRHLRLNLTWWQLTIFILNRLGLDLHGCGCVILWFVMATEMDIVRISAGAHFVTEVARPPFGLHMFGFHVVFHVLARTTEVFASTALEARLSSLTDLAV